MRINFVVKVLSNFTILQSYNEKRNKWVPKKIYPQFNV